jgi:ribonuclease D
MFDTEKAAQLLGYPSSSLSFLLERHFDRRKEKKLTVSNWNLRPLSSEMLNYAALDVAYLHQLREILIAELQVKGRLSWQEEECLQHEGVRYRDRETPHLRIKGAEALTDQEAHVLKDIFEVRNAIAQELDKPPFYVIKNPLMLKLARRPPVSQEGWANLKGVHPRVRRNAQRFHRAVVNSQDTAPDPSPTPITPDSMDMSKGAYNELVDRRIEILDIICKQIQQEYDDIAGRVFTPRTVRRIATGEASLDGLRRWQRGIVDQKAEELDLDMSLFL